MFLFSGGEDGYCGDVLHRRDGMKSSPDLPLETEPLDHLVFNGFLETDSTFSEVGKDFLCGGFVTLE